MADAIGEVTNMIAGSFRTRMAAFQDAWAITVPTVTDRVRFLHQAASPRAIACSSPSRMEAHEMFVELIITPDADAAV